MVPNPAQFPQRRVAGRLSDYTKYRVLEMLPGILVWTTFALAIALSFAKPLWAIYFIIVFDIYWLVRVVYLMIYLIISYRRFRRDVQVHWMEKVQQLPNWQRLRHLVFLPTAGESEEVIRGSLEALRRADYPSDKVFIVLATEERRSQISRPIAAKLQQEYGTVFGRFFTFEHPDGLAGEMKAKGANIAWAGRKVKEVIDAELKLPYEDIVVSSFDVDTQVHPQYLSYLTHAYLTHPNPTRTSFQPVPLYNNNLWQSPALMRIAANSTTFWLMTEQVRPERLFTFSSHAMSFRALVDVDFWQNDIVTDDSRIFLQCFLRYDGDYTVTPMYIPVSMDTVLGPTLWRSLVNLYKQQRRWAYGVENFPYMAWYFPKNRLIPWTTKFRYLWNQLEGIYSWATAPILIFILGSLPLWVGGHRLGTSAVAQNAPQLLQWLQTAAMVGLILSAVLSTSLLPPRPKDHGIHRYGMMVLQWILFPIVMILFGSIPATDAQTRLMTGKYLGFWVTEKHRS